MGYIESEQHFINYLRKAARENIGFIKEDQLMTPQMYLDLIYCKNLQDKYCWFVKQDATILEESKTLEWLSSRVKNNCIEQYAEDYNLCEDFINEIDDLNDTLGIFSFWNKDERCLFIGSTTNLKDQILSSFLEKFKNFNSTVYLKYLKAATKSDTVFIETFLICKLKPVFNTSLKFDDQLNFEIAGNIPAFSNPIICNFDRNKI